MHPIDQLRTGQKLKIMFKLAGYDVKYIQEYLNLSCPQPIYRWFKGQNLPTVEKLYALSILLGVHMEELLVFEQEGNPESEEEWNKKHPPILGIFLAIYAAISV